MTTIGRTHDRRPIPTRAHGMLDYLVGAVLIAAPWIFQFDDVGAAKWTAIGVGAAIIVTSLMTDYELGVARVIPMPVHLMTDAAAGVVLIASPWLFGFADEGANAWVPHVLVGIGEIGAALMTRRYPDDRALTAVGRGQRRLDRAA